MNDKMPLESKKFWAFLITDLALLVAMLIATQMKTPAEICAYVFTGIVISGLGIILGQAGVDAVTAVLKMKAEKTNPLK